MHSTDSLTQLINRVKVTVPANSQVLAISCQASSPDNAATCAQSFAQAYLTYKSTSTTADAKNQISALESQISSLERASAKLIVEAASGTRQLLPAGLRRGAAEFRPQSARLAEQPGRGADLQPSRSLGRVDHQQRRSAAEGN